MKMTISRLYSIWSKNINAEYITPTLQELEYDNFIIVKDKVQAKVEVGEKYREDIYINGKKYILTIKEVKC